MNMKTLRQDIPAGLVVFLVALPLCLGIAQASGLPPFVGLLTGVIGGLVVTTFSPSKFAVSGPAAGLVTIVTGAIETLGSFSALLLALMIAGVLQFLMGALRAGRFITLVPGSVIKGMLAAIGILLIIQQIPVALGAAGESDLTSLLNGGSLNISLPAIAVASAGLLVLWLWTTKTVKNNRWLGWMPGPLMAVLLGCLATVLGGRFFPDLASGLPRISLPTFDSVAALTSELERPDWQAWQNPAVYLIAATLAIVASLETLLSQEALKKLRPQHPAPSPDKEMRAQGIGNALSGFLGGLPITAVIVRSSVNVSAGAQSKLSILLHGALLLVCGLWFSGVLNAIPLASLAAVLLYTGYKLATPGLFVSQIRQGAPQSVPFLATIGGILMFGMLAGIGIGLATQILFSIYKSHRNAMLLTRYDDHYVLRFQQNLTFMHNPRLKGLLAEIPENSVVIVDHDSAEYIDPDVKALLHDFGEGAKKRGIQLNQWPWQGTLTQG
ncbi:SulP family transporter [Erwinia persicina]|uniref:SulP family inorganic anion transporter n=1 Tax=Erwinia persicina TaxID=55211 RepID=UPI000E4E4EDE|nr:SulP family inorganic anion transporter [Erwinia persicina]AXU96536.1 SulP family transporter [Erwinia persicina]QZQ49707.1 SulP family inorganic anion transporter [Erwinia persicina]